MTAPAPVVPSWTEAAAAVVEAVEALTRVPAADLADTQLAPAMAQMAVQASRLHAVAVDVVSEADVRRVWKTQGASSMRGWVRRCVQLADDSTRLVTAARARRHMPKMAALFSAGQVSLAQMGTAARQIRRLPDAPAWPRPGDVTGGDGGAEGCTDGGAEPDASGGAGPATGCATEPGADSPSEPGTGGPDEKVNGNNWDERAARWGDLRSAADEILAERAETADARMLAALGEQIHAAADPGDHLGEELSQRDRRHLSISKSFEGMGEVTGRLDPEATERAVTVLNALSEKASPTMTAPPRSGAPTHSTPCARPGWNPAASQLQRTVHLAGIR